MAGVEMPLSVATVPCGAVNWVPFQGRLRWGDPPVEPPKPNPAPKREPVET